MKKFSFILIAIAAMFVSCSKELDTISINNEVEYIEVPVKAFLNNVELTGEESLTKSGAEVHNLWCIQITGKSSCHGLYEDISLLSSVKLVKGEKYYVTACYTPDVNDDIYQYAGTTNTLGAPYNFWVWATNNHTAERNKIEYDDYSFDPWGYYEQERNIDKKFYYYHTENYIAEENSPITIDFILVNAGFKFIFEKVEGFEYDYVNISFGDNMLDGTPYFLNAKVNLVNGEGEYTIPNLGIYDPWYDEFSHEISFGTDENVKLFWSGVLKQKRGTLRTYTVKLQPQGSDTNININYSSEEQSEADMGNLN